MSEQMKGNNRKINDHNLPAPPSATKVFCLPCETKQNSKQKTQNTATVVFRDRTEPNLPPTYRQIHNRVLCVIGIVTPPFLLPYPFSSSVFDSNRSNVLKISRQRSRGEGKLLIGVTARCFPFSSVQIRRQVICLVGHA